MPLWLMLRPKRLINFMVVVGKSQDSANRLLGDIQAELEYNQRIIADFGQQKNLGLWTAGEFKTASGVKFLAVAVGSRRVDCVSARRVRTTLSSMTLTMTSSAVTRSVCTTSPTG